MDYFKQLWTTTIGITNSAPESVPTDIITPDYKQELITQETLSRYPKDWSPLHLCNYLSSNENENGEFNRIILQIKNLEIMGMEILEAKNDEEKLNLLCKRMECKKDLILRVCGLVWERQVVVDPTSVMD
ncbi:hypothetical protein ABK040_002161 [Willaertia magna]